MFELTTNFNNPFNFKPFSLFIIIKATILILILMKKNARNWANSTWSTEYQGHNQTKTTVQKQKVH